MWMVRWTLSQCRPWILIEHLFEPGGRDDVYGGTDITALAEADLEGLLDIAERALRRATRLPFGGAVSDVVLIRTTELERSEERRGGNGPTRDRSPVPGEQRRESCPVATERHGSAEVSPE